MSFQVIVQNFRRASMELKRFPMEYRNSVNKATKNLASKTLKEQIRVLRDVVYGSAPSPKYKRTGHLGQAHTIKELGNENGFVIMGIIWGNQLVDYAPYVEFGSPTSPPRPWIFPSALKIFNSFSDEYKESVMKAWNKTCGQIKV